MPTLNWIGKDAVVNHQQRVPFHLLKDVPALACGAPGDGNLIVQGDNLVALKGLLPIGWRLVGDRTNSKLATIGSSHSADAVAIEATVSGGES